MNKLGIERTSRGYYLALQKDEEKPLFFSCGLSKDELVKLLEERAKDAKIAFLPSYEAISYHPLGKHDDFKAFTAALGNKRGSYGYFEHPTGKVGVFIAESSFGEDEVTQLSPFAVMLTLIPEKQPYAYALACITEDYGQIAVVENGFLTKVFPALAKIKEYEFPLLYERFAEEFPRLRNFYVTGDKAGLFCRFLGKKNADFTLLQPPSGTENELDYTLVYGLLAYFTHPDIPHYVSKGDFECRQLEKERQEVLRLQAKKEEQAKLLWQKQEAEKKQKEEERKKKQAERERKKQEEAARKKEKELFRLEKNREEKRQKTEKEEQAKLLCQKQKTEAKQQETAKKQERAQVKNREKSLLLKEATAGAKKQKPASKTPLLSLFLLFMIILCWAWGYIDYKALQKETGNYFSQYTLAKINAQKKNTWADSVLTVSTDLRKIITGSDYLKNKQLYPLSKIIEDLSDTFNDVPTSSAWNIEREGQKLTLRGITDVRDNLLPLSQLYPGGIIDPDYDRQTMQGVAFKAEYSLPDYQLQMPVKLLEPSEISANANFGNSGFDESQSLLTNYNNAVSMFKKGGLATAELIFQAIIEKYKNVNDPYVYNSVFFLAETDFQNGNLPEAKQKYEKILQENRHHLPESLLKLAEIAIAEHDYKQASHYLQRAIDGYPGSAQATLAKEKLSRIKRLQ